MKVKLNLFERWAILGVTPGEKLLPEKAGFITLEACRLGREKLLITAKEIKYYELKDEVVDGTASIRFDAARASEDKEFEIPDICYDTIKKKLVDMNKSETLTSREIPLYKKIVGVDESQS